MILEIDDNKTIADIQDKFNTFFSGLSLEFYQHPHHWYEHSSDKIPFDPQTRVGEIRKNHPHGVIEIHSWFRTGDLEQMFRKKFNLNVQVVRMNGKEEIETAGTDKLTLAEQNDLAKRASGTEN
ncbi:MAG: hypothetical protein JST81_02565 [Bacteroidetes bacterium]|jgi:hypothetical protein|nr:hypothetical protein [Bacteroidota bacterium]